MSQTTYGSITIVDITDAGQLSAYPTSNMPLSIIYDPNEGNGGSYTPNWSSNNLVLTPVIYYNNRALTPAEVIASQGGSIVWQRREGIGNITSLTTGETVSSGVLTVNQNKFSVVSPAVQPSMITYIVTVTYQDPTIGSALTASGQITFSLVKLASTAKTCSIVGDTVFKYRGDGTLVGSANIVLTAQYSGVSLSQWQYKHPTTGVWTQFPQSSNTPTFTVNESTHANLFGGSNNDKSVLNVRLTTSDENTFDYHTIVKLRDGAAGTNAVTAVLTNEDQMVAVPVSGSIDYSDCVSRIIIYKGGEVDTSNWSIALSPQSGSGINYTSSATVQTNDTVTVTGISGNTASITFTCTDTRQIYDPIIKVFSVVKVEKGANGVSPTIYSLDLDGVAINSTYVEPNSGDTPTFTPSSLVVRSYSKTGNDARVIYGGRIVITSGNTTIHSVERDESSYTITSTDMSYASANGYMTVTLYAAGGGQTPLDTQTIVITTDGKEGDKGDVGNNGTDAINVILGNQADVIPCDSNNKTLSDFTIDIPFTAYKGITQVGCTVAGTVTVLGKTATVTPAGASTVGHITFPKINQNTTISNATGTASITFVCEGKNIVHTYRWSRSNSGTNGVNAVLFDVYTSGGNYFTSRDSQDITMYARLMDGATEATSSASNWIWSKFDPTSGEHGAYVPIAGSGTSPAVVGESSITINNSTVEGYASYRVTCQYGTGNTTYTAYYALYDKLDPIQAQVLSSIGNQIVNKQGVGALYVLVTDTGTGLEIDPLKSDRFLTSAPTTPTPVLGDFYYHLDTTYKVVTLKKYNGNSWEDATSSDLPTGDYSWTYRNQNGEVTVPTGMATTGKVIYIDSSFVTKKLIADVTVQI